ncbi:2645_t:CDS:2, partial [Gigaspora rosea]
AELAKGQLDQYLDRKLIEEGLSEQKITNSWEKTLGITTQSKQRSPRKTKEEWKAPKESRTPYFKNRESK